VSTPAAGFAADTYLVGSSVPVPLGLLKATSKYRCRFTVTKTAAGVATPIVTVRFGTAGSTADAARCTLTFAAQTAAVDEGTQAEQIYVFDLALPVDFAPRNQDGEVGEHRLARIDEVARWIEEGALTVDASLATLDCLLRRRWIDEEACEGMQTVFSPPAL